MKKFVKKASMVILGLAIFFTGIAVPKADAFAAALDTAVQSHSFHQYAWPGNTDTTMDAIVYYTPHGNSASREYCLYSFSKFSNPTSSNRKVATVSVKKEDKVWVLKVLLKKTGTTTISYRDTGVKSSFLLTVKNYPSPVASLKIGSASLTSKFKNSCQISGKKLSGKIQAKGKNGWKLASAWKFKISSLTSNENTEQIHLNLKKKITVEKGYRLCLQFRKGEQEVIIRYDAK